MEKKIPVIAKHNFVPVKLQMMFGATELAIGTGFFYRFMNSTHLVTTWHNFTGREPETNQTKHTKAGVPDKVNIGFVINATKGDTKGIGWDWRSYSLYADEDMQRPSWSQHPIHGQRVDVVTVALSGLEETATLPANDPALEPELIRLRPGLDVFILGFPLGMSGLAHFPIWKRGSIATEPDFDLDGLPKLFVDTATREGMSGAPVFAQETGFWLPEDKTELKDSIFGAGLRFLGIYSGRVGDDTFQAQLGIVWKPQAIEEIIKHSEAHKKSRRVHAGAESDPEV